MALSLSVLCSFRHVFTFEGFIDRIWMVRSCNQSLYHRYYVVIITLF
jgi:hypothetical protein